MVVLPYRDISFSVSLLSYVKGKEGKGAWNIYHAAFKQEHKHKSSGGEPLSSCFLHVVSQLSMCT